MFPTLQLKLNRLMRRQLWILFLVLSLFLFACKNEQAERRIIDRAEALLSSYPDSTRFLLQSVLLPEVLSDPLLTRWCFVYGQMADTLGIDMPYPSQLLRAAAYCRRHGTLSQQARIELYLGRSYKDDAQYEKAMQTYLPALEKAIQGADLNLAGYICNCMAELYEFDEMYDLAADKFREAGDYFRRAGNRRGYVFALRDRGRMYAFMDSCKQALDLFHQGELLATELQDSTAIASIYNGLGNLYETRGKLDLAEYYQKKSLQLDKSDSISTYLALISINRAKGDFSKADAYLLAASQISSDPSIVSGIAYERYLVEKERKNMAGALNALEKYMSLQDSVNELQNRISIVQVEKKYNHMTVLAENMKLRMWYQRGYILVMALLFFCSLLVIVYIIKIKQKNRLIYKQHELVMQKDIYLLNLSLDLKKQKEKQKKLYEDLIENKKKLRLQGTFEQQELLYQQKQKELKKMDEELLQLRKEKLASSSIAKKINKLSQKVLPGATTSPLKEKDWQEMSNMVDSIYMPFSDLLMEKYKLTFTEVRICYLSFFELNTNECSILLNISPDSVNKYRQRVRQKLGIVGKKYDLNAYLIDMFLLADN